MKLRTILLEPEYEGNVGRVARTMKNFNFSDLWLVNPKIDIGNEAKTFAMHAKDVLNEAKIVKELDSATDGCSYIAGTTSVSAKRPNNLLRMAITPEDFAQRIVKYEGNIGIIFGRESKGLSNEELTKCDIVVTIPTNSNYKALNIAIASAIIFYELFKIRHKLKKGSMKPSSSEARIRLVNLFKDLIDKTDMPEHRKRFTKRVFINLISRSLASSREVSLMTGALRKIFHLIKN